MASSSSLHVLTPLASLVLTGKKVTIPGGSFKSTTGNPFVPLSIGSNTGHLYLLERSMFFIEKHALNIPYDQIEVVEFMRHSEVTTTNRNFDLDVRLKQGKSVLVGGRPKTSITFSHIAREERAALTSLFKQKEIRLKGLKVRALLRAHLLLLCPSSHTCLLRSSPTTSMSWTVMTTMTKRAPRSVVAAMTTARAPTRTLALSSRPSRMIWSTPAVLNRSATQTAANPMPAARNPQSRRPKPRRAAARRRTKTTTTMSNEVRASRLIMEYGASRSGERRLALITALPRPLKRARPDGDDPEVDEEQEEDVRAAAWVQEPDALDKWALALAVNAEARELERHARRLLHRAGVASNHPARLVEPPLNSAADRLRWCQQVFAALEGGTDE